jgi:hypothetical protein
VVTSSGNATAIADKALAIAKLADGTDGELITWNASGVIAAVAAGSADQVLTSNGAGAAPTFQAAGGGGGGATAREGGDTTEATTTSTSAVDLLNDSSNIDIAPGVPFDVRFAFRKTSGASDDCGFGLQLNTTDTCNASTSDARRPRTGASNGNYDGHAIWHAIGRHNDYKAAITGMYASHNSTGGNDENDLCTATDNVLPDATIDAVTITGISDNSGVTAAADDLHVYSLAVS